VKQVQSILGTGDTPKEVIGKAHLLLDSNLVKKGMGDFSQKNIFE
jgi:hypothetical protein